MAQGNTAELLERALKLPPEDRLALATELLNSVEGGEDEEWTTTWTDELDRRAAAAERGETALHDWRDVSDEIRTELQRK